MSQLILKKYHVFKNILIGQNTKLLFFYFLVYLLFLQLYRVVFSLWYAYRIENEPGFVIGKAFLVGLRFDLATLSIVLGFFFLLSSLNFLNRFKVFSWLWSFTPIPLFFWFIGILISDLVYYENANKHIGYEAFVFLSDFFMIFFSLWDKDRLVFLLSCFTALVIFPFVVYLFIKKNPYHYRPAENSYQYPIQFFLFSLLLIFLIRGGFQQVPLRSSSSIISNNSFVNNIGLNGVYTAIMDLQSHTIPKVDRMNLVEASSIVRNSIAYPGAKFVSDKYPILRKTIQDKERNQNRPPNIILILLESWTGKYTSPISDGRIDGKEVTPNFNKLTKEGTFYINCFANGGRTTNGMMAALAGIPDRPGLTAVRTPQILGKFSGLGNIAQSLGYKTLFITGGEMKFDNNHIIMPHWGYETLIGKEVIDTYKKFETGAWGYDDEISFSILDEELNQLDPHQPFLATLLTLSTHYPYKTPDKKFDRFSETTQDHEYLNVYHYADWALGEYIEKAKKSAYFNNTIFLFISDHAHHRFLDYYEDRNIPFLIYAPGKVPAEIRKEIVSQLDIVPTILGFLNQEVYFSAMGKDVYHYKNSEGGYSYFAYGSVYGWIEKNIFYFRPSNGIGEIVMTVSEPHVANPECKVNPLTCQNYHQKAKAYLNLSIELMNKNIVFPTSTENLE
jgi:phosphoglycerol transferase MdoB-like AlkP superfamily enzyme